MTIAVFNSDGGPGSGELHNSASSQATGIAECHQCGQVQQLPQYSGKAYLLCNRCGVRLQALRPGWRATCAALTLTGLVLFVISNSFNFISLELGGLKHHTDLLTGVTTLWDNQQQLLAGLVFITTFLFPLLELLCLAYVLLPQFVRGYFPARILTLRLMRFISRWNLLEVFLLGVLVSSVKLSGLADVVPGIALFSFAVLVFVLLATQRLLDYRSLWDSINPQDHFSQSAAPETMLACHGCQARVGRSIVHSQHHCPRCGTSMHRRIPYSLQKTAAYLFTAVVLYLPANMLPIMITTHIGGAQSDTIMSGVIYLSQGDTWPLAVVVLVASVLVPISKILILIYLWISVRYRLVRGIRQRSRLFRLTELVGHWSMVDVYVVILTVALVKFGLIANVDAGPAALAFGGVVIFTMLAAESFDPRLMWDVIDEHNRTTTN